MHKVLLWQLLNGMNKNIGVVIGIIIIVGIGYFAFFGDKTEENNVAIEVNSNMPIPSSDVPEMVAEDEQTTQTSAQQAPTDIDIEGRSFKGAKDAKIIMVEYSSFSCVYCNRVRGTVDQILETYPNDVKVVYKHFNRGGTDSQTAQATECAGDQGKFWEMHDMIFDKGSSGNMEKYAKDIGLNMASFNECVVSDKYESRVQQDTSEGRSLGVGGTPSFSINGKLVVGAQPFESFKQVIDAALAN